MHQRRVAIVYTHPLFAEGIARLLEADPRLCTSSVDAKEPVAADELRRFQPEVVIVAHNGEELALGAVPVELLSSEQPSLLVVVGLKNAELRLFSNRRVAMATPDNLLEMVLEGWA